MTGVIRRRVAPVFVLLVVFVGASATALWALAGAVPWLRFTDASTGPQDPAARAAAAAGVRPAGQTPAERALAQTFADTPRGLASWSASPLTTTPTPFTLGFGCEPRAGVAPASAAQRSWTSTSSGAGAGAGGETLTVQAAAYPAGGGALVLDALRQAVIECQAADLAPAITGTGPGAGAGASAGAGGLGVEAVGVVTAKLAAVVWRRGDVVVVAYLQAPGGGAVAAARYLSDVGPAVADLDAALNLAVAGDCADPGSTLRAAARSPYLARGDYAPYTVPVQVYRPPTQVRTGEDIAEEAGVPIVDIPAAPPAYPNAGEIPTPPDPAPTRGPARLPAPVVEPSAPAVPSEPSESKPVAQERADEVGPGCGWAFTGQIAPRFSASRAEARFAAAQARAEKALVAAWARYQRQRAGYFTAWADYLDAVRAYRSYATQIGRLREAWAPIEAARERYLFALGVYLDAVRARAEFRAAREQAKRDYAAAKRDCARPSTRPSTRSSSRSGARPDARREPTPFPTLPPSTPSPTGGPSPSPTSKPTPTPTVGPSPTGQPSPTGGPDGSGGGGAPCPPPRPAILDQPEPDVPSSPTPEPDAQLPRGYRP